MQTRLKFVLFQNLGNWSVRHLLGRSIDFSNKYPTVSIGDIIKKSFCTVRIKDDVQYKQITLKINGGGALLRCVKLGKDIKTKKQYLASVGQFIMSKIDARNGAFGIIKEDLDGAVVTADFPLFDVDETKILPEYLALVASTKKFAQFAQSCSKGTTNRQRIDINMFLSQHIPLPSTEEQIAIVGVYNDSFKLAEQYDQQAKAEENNIQLYILQQLGISNNSSSSNYEERRYSYLNLYHYKDILRWDCYNHNTNTQSQVYQTVCLSNLIIEKPKYGAGYKTAQKPNEIRYIRITDINEDGTLNEDYVSADQFDERYLLKQDDLLIARSGNTVGKSFLYDSTYGKAIYAGYLIKFVIDKSKINPRYLLAYTKSTIFKQWIQGNMRVSAQPNINSRQYLDAPIIVPPLTVQREMVEHITKSKELIKSLRSLAATTRTDAIKQFEQTVFE